MANSDTFEQTEVLQKDAVDHHKSVKGFKTLFHKIYDWYTRSREEKRKYQQINAENATRSMKISNTFYPLAKI